MSESVLGKSEYRLNFSLGSVTTTFVSDGNLDIEAETNAIIKASHGTHIIQVNGKSVPLPVEGRIVWKIECWPKDSFPKHWPKDILVDGQPTMDARTFWKQFGHQGAKIVLQGLRKRIRIVSISFDNCIANERINIIFTNVYTR